jgi:anti-sigma regulatory factor (Ser/Thr protein kinase)
VSGCVDAVTQHPPDSPLLLVVPATLLDARATTERLMQLCERLPEGQRALYETAVMEWLTNVVKHSYEGIPNASFFLRADPMPDAIRLVIEDFGCGMPEPQFNGAPVEVYFDPEHIGALPESGFGVAILKTVMDDVRYEQGYGVNRLTAIKRWAS